MNCWLLCISYLWLWLGKTSVLVSADYVVQIELEYFSNPSNRRLNGGCCDQIDSTDCTNEPGRCDTYFSYCLRRFNTNTNGCPDLETVVRSENAIDRNFISFSQPIVLGLTNPFNLPGLSLFWQGVQLYIEVSDFNDGSFDNLLNIYSFDIPSTILIGARTRVESDGFTDSSFLIFYFTVLCAPFYSGTNCQTRDDCGFNSITCNGRGVCVDGIGSYACDCSLPYFGENCEQEYFCFGRNCSGRGTCANNASSYSCSCDPGYTGVECEVDIDECLLMEPVECSGQGSCSHGINSFNCSCDPGYTGERCEVDIDECLLMEPVECSARGSCSHGINSFNCSCYPGYTGERCEVDIDECAAVNCSGNGVCVDGVNSFSCQCEPGFTGEVCSTEEQRGVPAAVLGGVVGGVVVLLLILLLLLVLLVAIVVQRTRTKTIPNSQDVTQTQSYIPGDNPVYEIPEHKTDTLTSEMAEFDNPIYGSNYSITDSIVVEVNNPIYGDADFEDTVHVYEQTPAAAMGSNS